MKPLKRIYYIPGLITLIIAPIIIIVKTKNYVSDSKEYCISIIMLPAEKNDYIKENFSPKRDYQTFELTGHIKTDSLKILFIENYAKAIALSKNDSIGIKVILGKKLKYNTYINLFNSCLKSGISNWIPWGDTIFILNKEYPVDYSRIFYQNSMSSNNWIDLGSCCLIFDKKPKISLFERIKYHKVLVLRTTPFIILLLMLVYQNIVFIQKMRTIINNH